ncbi:MAG TPA: DUF3568 family protein [Planctomycetota bacterium]
MKIENFKLMAFVVVVLVSLSSCRKSNNASPPEEKDAPVLRADGKKVTAVDRFMGRDVGPLYRWDGTMSSITLEGAPEVIFARAWDALQRMGFALDQSESQRTTTGGRIAGAKQDKTTVLVLVQQKAATGTEVKARIGTVGERNGSERVLEEIQKALRAPARRSNQPAPPAPAEPAPPK